MIRSRSASLLSPLALAAALVAGCSGAVTTDLSPATATGTEATRAPVAPAAHGMVRRVADALGEVSLRADQRAALESLAADAEARHALASSARQDLAQALAAQVSSGALDRPALQPKVEALVAAQRAAQPKDRAAFEAVHAILDAGQREEFVTAMKGHGHAGGLWDRMKHAGGPAQRWADDLLLTADQRGAFERLVRDSFAGHQGEGRGRGMFHGPRHGGAVLDAFRSDTFSFDQVAPAEDVGERTATMTGHVLDLVEKVLPLLTAEQRALAAAKIRERSEGLPFAPGM